MSGRSYAFVFICQEGDLEVQSLLLAASLRRFLRCQYEMIAAIPSPETDFGRPGGTTLALLAGMGARTVSIRNGINPLYTHANKIACLNVRTDADKIVFLDTDILCLREFHDEPRFGREINVKPADLQTFTSSEELWRIAYEAAGVAIPGARMASTVSLESGPPYFNSGFIALNRGIDLGGMWISIAHALNKVESIPKKNPWSDQPSLAIAIQALKLDYDCLDERYNFPAHARRLDAGNIPWFCHYHYPEVIRNEPHLVSFVHEITAACPGIGETMRRFEKWAPLAG